MWKKGRWGGQKGDDSIPYPKALVIHTPTLLCPAHRHRQQLVETYRAQPVAAFLLRIAGALPRPSPPLCSSIVIIILRHPPSHPHPAHHIHTEPPTHATDKAMTVKEDRDNFALKLQAEAKASAEQIPVGGRREVGREKRGGGEMTILC